MKLNEIKEEFLQSKLSKPDFIVKMYDIHKHLFEYSEFMKNTDIKKIEIEDGKVVMSFRSQNLKLFCIPGDERVVPIEVLNFGKNYENSEWQIIKKVVSKNLKKDFTFFDIGANIGWYSLVMSRNFPESSIYCFEPIPITYSYLMQNIQLNDIKNINANNFGFANKEEKISFYYYPEGFGNASLKNLSERESVKEVKSQIKKLDNFVLEKNLPVDFIKCDVEGAELFVFEGGLETIKKNKPIIFSEMLRKWSKQFNYHPNKIIELLGSIGYQCYSISEEGLKLFTEMDENTIETDYLFIDPKKHSIE